MYRYIPRYAAIALLALAGAACGGRDSITGPELPDTSTSAPSIARSSITPACVGETGQTPACFEADGTVTVGNAQAQAIIWNEDQPLLGYLNHWHYLIAPGAAAQLLSRYEGTKWHGDVGGGALIYPGGRGGMTLYTNAWRLDLRPTDDAIAAQFAAWAPASETRSQSWTVNMLPDGSAEIRIEEPCDGTPFRMCP